MSRTEYQKLAKISKRKLDKLEYEHQQHLTRFSGAMESKMNHINELERSLEKLRKKAERGMQTSVPKSLGTAMEMRVVKSDLLIAKSVLTVLRSNRFYHRMMVILIQDVKSGVEYDPRRIDDLIPAEFSELVEGSVLSTKMEGLLGELKSDLEGGA